MPLTIEANKLSKTYKSGFFHKKQHEALKSLDLAIEEGEIFAFLGPNGAGKSTTINMLMGFLKPSAGEVKLFGQNPEDHEVRRKLGFLPENYSFYTYMSAVQLLDYFADLMKISKADRAPRIEKLLVQLDLWEARNRSIGGYSRGMKQRLGIVQALLNNPSLLILDEPTSGFDPSGRKMVRDLLLELKANGTSILLSSHILSEVETVCDRVAIINKGQLLKQGPLHEILGGKSYEIRYGSSNDELDQALKLLGEVQTAESERIVTTADFEIAQKIVAAVVSGGGILLSLIPKVHTLEDVFLDTIEKPEGK